MTEEEWKIEILAEEIKLEKIGEELHKKCHYVFEELRTTIGLSKLLKSSMFDEIPLEDKHKKLLDQQEYLIKFLDTKLQNIEIKEPE